MDLQLNPPTLPPPSRHGLTPADRPRINPLLAAHEPMIPAGPILFLGSGDSVDAVELARNGRAITVFDESPERLVRTATLARALGARLELHQGDAGDWRLGLERWAAIVVLFSTWPTPARRRLFGQIPNALKPGGLFILEGHAFGPEGPSDLDDNRLDPEDARPELEMLTLSRFATVSRTMATDGGAFRTAPVLQIVGIHPQPRR